MFFEPFRKPYFNHGLNSIEQMEYIWDDIMFDRYLDEQYAAYNAYKQTDQFWKDYMTEILEDFLTFPEDYGMGEVA